MLKNLERIHSEYQNKGVEVWFVVQNGDINQLAYFNQQFNIQPSYTILADPGNIVASLYATTTSVATIIIDKTGVVRYAGGYATWAQLSDELEVVIGMKEVNLSSAELALKSLKSPDSYIRWKAARVLGDMKSEGAVPELIAALKDESASVRESAAQALGNIGSKEAVKPLIAAFEDKSDMVRAEIVKALLSLKDEQAITPLVKSLADANLRNDAARALAEINKPELVSKSLEENSSFFRQKQAYEMSEAYASLGSAYQERNMYEAAIPLFSRAAETAPDSYRKNDFVSNLASCYIEMGESEKAAAEYLKAVKNASVSNTSIWTSYPDGTYEGLNEREWAMRGFVESYQYRNKLDELTKILEAKVTEPQEDAILYEILGNAYTAQGMSQKAVPMYEKAVELNPNYTKDYARLISAYSSAGMTDKAAAAAKEMAKKPTGNANFYSLMAKAYIECKMYDEAIAAYKKAVAMSVQNELEMNSNQLGLANCYVSAGKYAEAVAEYESIIKKSANDQYRRDMAETKLWEVYGSGNLYDTAIEKYQKLAEAEPENAKVYEYLARAYQGKGQTDKAIAVYEKTIKQKPDDAGAYNALGDIYRAQGDMEKAISYYRNVSMLDPTNTGLYVTIGDYYRSKGMEKEAVAEYDKSQAQALENIRQGSIDPWLYNNLAWFYAEKKIKPREAVTFAKKALELAPGQGAILDTLGWAYLRNGQFDEALKAFSEVLAGEPASVSAWKGIAELAKSPVNTGVFIKLCDDMSKKTAGNVSMQMQIHTAMASFYEHRGEKEKAQKEWAKMGFIRESGWLALGPFDNTNGDGFSRVYPPEQKIDIKAVYQEKGKKIGWTAVKDSTADAYIDLNEMFGKPEWVAAYTLARVISPADREAQLRVGSDDDAKVWLNGKEVLSQNIPRSAAIDQDVVPVRLKSGVNEILLKVCDRTVDWGFYLRITDANGNPYSDLKYISAADMIKK